MSLLWINGTLTDKLDARVSPFDHGLLYGDGVWEHLRVFGGKLFRPLEHLDQLFAAAATLGIDIPLSRDRLTAAIEATVKANDRTDGYVRVIVTRGPGTIGPDPRKVDPQVIIVAEEYQPFPQELYGHGLHVVIAEGLIPQPVRALGNLNVALAKRAALANGCLDAIVCNAHGFECATTEGNLYFFRDGVLAFIPSWPIDAIRDTVILAAGSLGLACGPVAVRASELCGVSELFLAGTACGVIGIVRIDGKDVGTGTEGPVTRRIRERYAALTRGAG